MKNGIERRRHLRAPIALTFILMTQKGPIKGKTANISVGGLALLLFLETPEIDDEFQITLKLPNGDDMALTCEKVWLGKMIADESVYLGVGVHFIKISRADREILASMVKEYYVI